MEYDKTNTGLLTRNDKQGNEKRPDYRGFLNVGGADFELAGWIHKRRSDGRPFLSLTVQPSKPKIAADPGATAPVGPPLAVVAPPPPPPIDEPLPF